jgi:parvulin-like peptidyl-prolyl isomerase
MASPSSSTRRLAAVALAVGGLLQVARRAQAEIIDGVAVVVNGDVILISEVEERAGKDLPKREATGDAAAKREAMLKHAVEDLVNEKLMGKQCKEQSLEPTSAELDNAIEDVQKVNKIDRPTLEKALKEQGLTMPRYRDMLSEQLCRLKVIKQKVEPRVTVGPDDVNSVLANEGGAARVAVEMKIRDIFVKSDASSDGARQTVLAAKRRLASGEDFAAVAHDTPGPLAASSGDLGWVKEADIAPDLQKPVSKLPVGGVSDIIETKVGYHIVKVEERRTSTDTGGIATKKEEIRQRLWNEKMEKATADYVAELRRSAEVDVRLATSDAPH